MHLASWEDLADPILLVLPVAAYDIGIVPCLAISCGAWAVSCAPAPAEAWLHTGYRYLSSIASLLFTFLFVRQLLSYTYDSTAVILPVALVAMCVSVYGTDVRPWQRVLEAVYIGTVVVYMLWRAVADRSDTVLNASTAAVFDPTSPSIGVLFLLNGRHSTARRSSWQATTALATLMVALALLGPFFMSGPSSSIPPLPRVAGPVVLWIQPRTGAFATLVYLLAILSRVSGMPEVPIDIPAHAYVRMALVALAAVAAIFAPTGCSTVLAFYSPILITYRIVYLPLRHLYGVYAAAGTAVPVCGYLAYCASRSVY